MRREVFFNGEYYHIYNRGVDKRDIFGDVRDYERFLLSMGLLNDVNDGLMIAWRDYKDSNPGARPDDFLKLSFRKQNLYLKQKILVAFDKTLVWVYNCGLSSLIPNLRVAIAKRY